MKATNLRAQGRCGRRYLLFAILLAGHAATAGTDASLRRMGEAVGKEYVTARDGIVSEGRSSLPQLHTFLTDEAKPWQLRLAAGICAERIEKGDAIDQLDGYNWFDDADYDAAWPITAAGYPAQLPALIHQRLVAAGFWYYYLEALWKAPENAQARVPNYGRFLENATTATTGVQRRFAAHIVEEHVLSEASGTPTRSGYAPSLHAFVRDGTYPRGARALLRFFVSKGMLGQAYLEEILDLLTVEDVHFLEDVLKTPSIPPAQREAIMRRLESLSACDRQPPTASLNEITGPASAPLAKPSPAISVGSGDHKRRWMRRFGSAGVAILFVGTGLLVWRHRRST